MKLQWKHFNFDVLHIDGKDNVEADALSRLVPFPSKESPSLNLNNLEQSEMIEPRQYLSKKIFNFGCPSEIVSDNASYFVSELTKSFVDFAKIKHSTIHPYSHEENGLVERANQEVIRHLTAIIADEDVRKNFPAYLPFIQRIINSQVNSRTSVSPTQIIFGNAINHDSHFLSEPLQNNLDKSAREYMSNMLQVQQKIISIAQQCQEQNDTHYIIAQERRGNFTQTHFPINSYVLVEYETRKDSKLHTKRHGPYRVINRIGTVYTLENLVTGKLRDYHVKLLSQYNHDEVNTDINKVAKIDEELADITQVLSHRFKSSKKTLNNLELLLVWEDDPKPTWFPWNSSFRSIDVIHRYFENNQMRKFIPPEFTWGKDHPDYTPPKRSRR